MLRILRSLIKSKDGNAILMVAAGLPVLIGSAGLATDTIQWSLWKRQAQRAADSAAMSGAYAVAQGKVAATSANADLARTLEMTYSATPIIETPPSTGSAAGDASAVRVVLEYSRVLPFSSLFLSAAPTIKAESVAKMVFGGVYCVISLDGSTNTGITMQGNATVNMGCGMAANSTSTSAVNTGGSATVTASPIAAVGSVPPSSNYATGTILLSHQSAMPDPYASLPTPSVSSCSPGTSINVGTKGNVTIGPGCYKTISVQGTLIMTAGIYYIDGGQFNAGSQANISGSDVTIILTSATAATSGSSVATLDVNAGAVINLSATTSGTYHGVLFYQDRRAADSGTNKFNGNSASTLQGSMYFPGQELVFNGTSGMTTDCLQLVSKRVTFTGNSSVVNSCPTNSGASAFTGVGGVRLVS